MSYSYGCYKLTFEAKGYKQANDDCGAQWQASTGDKECFKSIYPFQKAIFFLSNVTFEMSYNL